MSIVLLLVIALFLGYQVMGLVEKRNISEEKRAKAEAEYERYKRQEEDLRERTESLETEEGKERAIRERFNVAKEGEGVIYVIEENETSYETEEEGTEEREEDRTFWGNVKSFFSVF